MIAVAAVANLNLSVANVALPSIGRAFDSSQTTLDLIAVGYSLGLAASVLYLGALGDRYGRKMMLLLGMALSIPACLAAAYAPSDAVLFAARVVGGVSAGMAYPTTLALITALWNGPARTRSIALWSAVGGGIAALGPLVAGALLEKFWWGSVFLVTLPLAVLALVMAFFLVPGHVNETTDPVDNLGGVLSVVLVGSLILAINFAPVPDKGTLALGAVAVAGAALIGFVIRQRRAENPLYDLHVAGRRVFWVAAAAGIIVFGSLMSSAFVSQQYLQNVLGYSTLAAGAAFLPAVVFMIVVAPRSAKLVESRGARFTLLTGYVFLLLAFGWMLLLWQEGSPYWQIGLAYAFIGIGVGFAGTPASHSLTGSVPVQRAGMASGTADLQRDLGGAILQSLFGALLTAGYAAAFTATIAASPESQQVTGDVQDMLTKSFSGAADIAQQYPQYSEQITAAAKASFLSGADWAYTAGIIAILLGTVLVFLLFPRKEAERRLLAAYHAEDTGGPVRRGPRKPGDDTPDEGTPDEGTPDNAPIRRLGKEAEDG
ncbi:MFS transporter [Planobispora takensis]|uniref:MFS transporter n=1 Tax=Planobispora takensis TaxID=1367882 RepID=A0A8J3WRI9_9ACTN|nr:MFS transporter [Planobispora takensis]